MSNSVIIHLTSDEPNADLVLANIKRLEKYLPSTRYPQNVGSLNSMAEIVYNLNYALSQWLSVIQIAVAQRQSVPDYAGLKKSPQEDPLKGTGTGF